MFGLSPIKSIVYLPCLALVAFGVKSASGYLARRDSRRGIVALKESQRIETLVQLRHPVALPRIEPEAHVPKMDEALIADLFSELYSMRALLAELSGEVHTLRRALQPAETVAPNVVGAPSDPGWPGDDIADLSRAA